MDTFEVGDRVFFREEDSTEDSKGTVTADLGDGAYTVCLDDEREDYRVWAVAYTELTKTA